MYVITCPAAAYRHVRHRAPAVCGGVVALHRVQALAANPVISSDLKYQVLVIASDWQRKQCC